MWDWRWGTDSEGIMQHGGASLQSCHLALLPPARCAAHLLRCSMRTLGGRCTCKQAQGVHGPQVKWT